MVVEFCPQFMYFILNFYHSSGKLSRGHTTVPMAEYQKLPSYVLEIKEHCNEHHETYTLYCKEHELNFVLSSCISFWIFRLCSLTELELVSLFCLILPIFSNISYLLEIKEHCNEHHETYTLYCKEHECPRCGICNVEDHKDCKEVAVLRNITWPRDSFPELWYSMHSVQNI
jgi:hypothetical protein